VDIVSKNGNLLVNIGPRSDGTIPEQTQATLRDIGAWLKINGEAIYGTRPWSKFGEGPTSVVEGKFHDTETKAYTAQDFRFTTKGNALYAIELAWPESGESVIQSLNEAALSGKKIVSIQLLGSNAPLKYKLQADGLHAQLPVEKSGSFAYALKIQFEKPVLN
jgi:alpha-L-fucosidase